MSLCRFRNTFMWLFPFLFESFVFLFTFRVSALRLTSVQVPSKVIVGEQVWLNCSFDLENDQLYSIKWYRDDLEFYRFLPTDNPQEQKYDSAGIYLDLSKSSYGNVYLSSTDFNTKGDFRCEVSAEAPSFQTVRETKTMKVYLNLDQASSSNNPHPLMGSNLLLLLIAYYYYCNSYSGMLLEVPLDSNN